MLDGEIIALLLLLGDDKKKEERSPCFDCPDMRENSLNVSKIVERQQREGILYDR
jgi:hypothetical protein